VTAPKKNLIGAYGEKIPTRIRKIERGSREMNDGCFPGIHNTLRGNRKRKIS